MLKQQRKKKKCDVSMNQIQFERILRNVYGMSYREISEIENALEEDVYRKYFNNVENKRFPEYPTDILNDLLLRGDIREVPDLLLFSDGTYLAPKEKFWGEDLSDFLTAILDDIREACKEACTFKRSV